MEKRRMAGAEKKTDSHPEVKTMRTTKTADHSSIQHSRSTAIHRTRAMPGSRCIPGASALKGRSDKALLSGIRQLSETERKTVLEILVHLIEIDRRRLYLHMGYSSLYEFCVKHLSYSESQAVRRTRTARCIRDYPWIFSLLVSGRVALSNVAKISRIITARNAEKLLREIEGRSAREVDQIVSSRRPKSAIRDKITPVYVKALLEIKTDDTGGDSTREESFDLKSGKKPTANVGGKNPVTSEDSGCGEGPATSPQTDSRLFAGQAFVFEERFRLSFGVDQEFLEKIGRIRALLSTKHHRELEFEELFEILIDEYIERHSSEGRQRRKEKRERRKAAIESKKTGRTDRSAAGASKGAGNRNRLCKQESSRYIPQKVRDEVYARDRGRCAFVSQDGRKCGSKWDLQVDHIVPFARGGDNSPSNLRLLCGKHNRLEAERTYGKKHMEQFVKEQIERYHISPDEIWRMSIRKKSTLSEQDRLSGQSCLSLAQHREIHT
jgi:5-methylcytosine-specific restriction endonuclease McrA